MTYAELLAELGTTKTSARFAEYHEIPIWVADAMIDKAWVINGIRAVAHTRGYNSWVRGGVGRDADAITLQHIANGLVKEMINAARTPK